MILIFFSAYFHMLINGPTSLFYVVTNIKKQCFFQFIFLHLKYELLTKYFTYKEYDTPCGPKSDEGDGPRIYYLCVANWLGFGTGHTTRIKEWIIVWHRDYHFYIISNETNETQWNLFKSFKTYWRKSKVNLLLLLQAPRKIWLLTELNFFIRYI